MDPSSKSLFWLIPIAVAAAGWLQSTAAETLPFNGGWCFLRADEPKAAAVNFDDSSWEMVTLPHTAHVEALVTGQSARQWQGICWYRKSFQLPANAKNKTVVLRLEGAMNQAQVWINGQTAGTFQGGYLPYVMDVSRLVQPGATNVVAVRLDNHDNPITGPKPLADLDFNLYGGLYRDASLRIEDPLHISDPLLADKIAGGGVFATFPVATRDQAIVHVQTHVENADRVPRGYAVRNTLLDRDGHVVVSSTTPPVELAAGGDLSLSQDLKVARPNLWSPQSPYLYNIQTEIVDRGKTVDSKETRIGIRRIQISADGFRINGDKMFLRGVNRHQEYPYLGNAVPDDAQYRDARKIKEAGFDYIRLSHYPQSPAFLNACDELGLVVMDSILGWQYFGKDPEFVPLKLRESRQLIRRDRNHPSVILWEVSLNESEMPPSFVTAAKAAAHEEYPGDQCYTCGWVQGYDVFLQARQHGGCKTITNQACVISEYGDWEYYAQNAGLEQGRWKDLEPAERSSRQLRGDGEIRLLQQALNFQEAHNDDLKTSAFGDGLWVMFDYNRGYAPDLESSGVMDIFRLPKFSYWFYRSQRDRNELVGGSPVGPVLFLANDWTPNSPLDVRVFSNCEEVALYLNGKLVERRCPDSSRVSTRLKHPPFNFKLDRFEPGTLKAVGFVGGREVVQTERRTPGRPSQLKLSFDLSARPLGTTGKDDVFCYAELLDSNGTVVPAARVPVFFGNTGPVRTVGHNPILSESGTASILVENDASKPACCVYALCLVPDENGTRVLSAAACPDGSVPPAFSIHYTTDGSRPDSRSPVALKPIAPGNPVRAALFVQDQWVAGADQRSSAPSTGDQAVLTARTEK